MVMLAGCCGKCGWQASTTDSNQIESLSVTSAPVPAALPKKASIKLKDSEPLFVMVNDSHFDSFLHWSKT